jgi:hypothetical protein
MFDRKRDVFPLVTIFGCLVRCFVGCPEASSYNFLMAATGSPKRRYTSTRIQGVTSQGNETLKKEDMQFYIIIIIIIIITIIIIINVHRCRTPGYYP